MIGQRDRAIPEPTRKRAHKPHDPQKREQQQVGLVFGQQDATGPQVPDLAANPPFFSPTRGRGPHIAGPLPHVALPLQLPAHRVGREPLVGAALQVFLEERDRPLHGRIAEILRGLTQERAHAGLVKGSRKMRPRVKVGWKAGRAPV